jgi:hypothetical protein
MEKGKARAIEKVTSKLMQSIEKNNLTAIMFFLRSQAGWCDSNTKKGQSDAEARELALSLTVDFKKATPTEAAEIYHKVMEG